MKDNDPTKETPEEIKKKVSKKLFAGQLKKTSNDNPPKKPDLNKKTVNTSGSYDFRDAESRPKLMMRKTIKKWKNKEGTNPKYLEQINKKDNVFQQLGKKALGGIKPFSGNATDLFDDNDKRLKTNPKHQDRVNKILGK